MEDSPESWKLARIILLFKKGDPANCENYRPISLLSIGYKTLAAILLSRLKAGGAEAKIWETQFGFRSGYGTTDALFIARRLLENVHAIQDKSCIMVALD